MAGSTPTATGQRPPSGCLAVLPCCRSTTWSKRTSSPRSDATTACHSNGFGGPSGLWRGECTSSAPLITAKFETDGVDLFVDELGKLINASREGQIGMESALRASLTRVEHDQDGLASRLFPFVRGEGEELKVILVDRRLSFGKPVVAKTGVPVSVIAGRYRAGEDVAAIATDYGISVDRTHDAIRTAIPVAA